ncbi:hypothetical protein R3P38DRAFT_3223557 [Favolaschia claudopus]|uniref:Uncharacterized protein n=1 Tax=Favolaschia claudopus TaxID=2862362 RepID=A0AAV9ZXI9_9AGAR
MAEVREDFQICYTQDAAAPDKGSARSTSAALDFQATFNTLFFTRHCNAVQRRAPLLLGIMLRLAARTHIHPRRSRRRTCGFTGAHIGWFLSLRMERVSSSRFPPSLTPPPSSPHPSTSLLCTCTISQSKSKLSRVGFPALSPSSILSPSSFSPWTAAAATSPHPTPTRSSHLLFLLVKLSCDTNSSSARNTKDYVEVYFLGFQSSNKSPLESALRIFRAGLARYPNLLRRSEEGYAI